MKLLTVKFRNNPKLAAMIGTALEYYDMSLYGFMTPLLVSIFLPNMDKIDAIILTFLTMPIGAFVRPLGAFIIGRIGDKHGRRAGLITGITGMAVVTVITGCLPTFNDVGVIAPILMLTCRVLQGFFVAGEYNGGAIFALEHTSIDKKGLTSGMYCGFTVAGILSAAAVTTAVSYLPEGYWRGAYFIGFFTAIAGIFIRRYVAETPEFLACKDLAPVKSIDIFKNYKPILRALAVSGFFSALYNFHTVLMISFLPMVTSFTVPQIMFINTCTTMIYLALLPVSGFCADKFGINRVMFCAAIIAIILIYPLVTLIKLNDYAGIFLMKAAFAIITAWFVGPFHAWIQTLFPVKARYTGVSISYSLGSQLGGAIPAIGLFVWKESGSLLGISMLLLFWAILAAIALRPIAYAKA